MIRTNYILKCGDRIVDIFQSYEGAYRTLNNCIRYANYAGAISYVELKIEREEIQNVQG